VGEIEIQVRLDGTAAAPAVRADTDVLGDSVPGKRRMIVGIQETVLPQSRPILDGHREIDHLHGAVVEKRVGQDLRERWGARWRYDIGRNIKPRLPKQKPIHFPIDSPRFVILLSFRLISRLTGAIHYAAGPSKKQRERTPRRIQRGVRRGEQCRAGFPVQLTEDTFVTV
jgi:hypothetical protein